MRDLTFDFPVTAAIQLWNTHHVRIVGNVFNGADVAINQWASVNLGLDLVVERNLSHYYPLYEWRRHGWLSWREVYRYSNSSLTWVYGKNIVIRGNVITQAGDGIKISPRGGQNLVAGNLIALATDDAMEFDGPSRNLTIRGNLVIDPFVMLGTSPVSNGPLLVEDNVFLFGYNPDGLGNGVLLKLLMGPIRHVWLRRNVYMGEQIGWGTRSDPLSDILLENNLLASVHGFDGIAYKEIIRLRGNHLVSLQPSTWPRPAQGPEALARIAGPVKPIRLPDLGPPWLRLGDDAATRPLLPLLRSGWIVGR